MRQWKRRLSAGPFRMSTPEPAARWLRGYSVLFAVAGACFVLGSGPSDALLGRAARLLPGAAPVPHAGPSLWLGLTGAMMAMIALLAAALSRDPFQPAAWRALLLSKAVSTALFLAFSAASRNSLFLIGAAVDGPILVHLLLLREALEADPWRPRLPAAGPFYEVWFAKLNDPASRAALWVRYTLTRADGALSGAVWYVLSDPALPKPVRGRLDTADCALGAAGFSVRIAGSRLEAGRLAGEAEGARWDLRWRDSGVPPLGLVPRLAVALGLTRTDYRSACPLAVFEGGARVAGRDYSFAEAPGSLGHLWGTAMAGNWRWAHAALRADDGSPAMLELLSARPRLGPFAGPRLTVAFLWHENRLYGSDGPLRALVNRLEGDGPWRLRIGFDGLDAEGTLAADARRSELAYEDPGGRRVLCRSTQTGALRLTLVRAGRPDETLASEDAAFVEEAREERA